MDSRGVALALMVVLPAAGVAGAAAAAGSPPLTARVLPPASAFNNRGSHDITRQVVPQSAIGLDPGTPGSCDGHDLPLPPAPDGAVGGVYRVRGYSVALIDDVYRYPSVAAARQAVGAAAAIAPCSRVVGGWAGTGARTSNATAVGTASGIGDEARFLQAQEVANDGSTTYLHLAIIRSGRYVILSQNLRDAPLTAAALPALKHLSGTELAALRRGTGGG